MIRKVYTLNLSHLEKRVTRCIIFKSRNNTIKTVVYNNLFRIKQSCSLLKIYNFKFEQSQIHEIPYYINLNSQLFATWIFR